MFAQTYLIVVDVGTPKTSVGKKGEARRAKRPTGEINHLKGRKLVLMLLKTKLRRKMNLRTTP